MTRPLAELVLLGVVFFGLGLAAMRAMGDAGIAFFTKQIATAAGRAAGDRKGGDPQHWPPGDWPRQFPEVSV